MTTSENNFVFASGLSTSPQPGIAAIDLSQQLSPRLGSCVDLLVLFVTPEHREVLPTLLTALRTDLSPRVTVGCTVQGVIGVKQEIEQGPAIAALAASLSGATLTPFTYEQLHWPSNAEHPDALRAALLGDMPLSEVRALLLLADPFSTPMTGLLPAITRALPGVPVIGGMASAGRQAGDNRLFLDDEMFNTGAVGVIWSGGIDVQTVVSQGCRPVGKPYVITKAQRHMVQELAGRKAMEVIQELGQSLPDTDRELLRHSPLMVGRVIDEYKSRFGRGDFLIRSLMGADMEDGYVAIADPQVRVGQTIQFHVRDQKTATEDFQLLLDGQKLDGPPAGALLFSCNGRGTRLFDHAHADAAMVHAALGEVPLAGFFAAGEIGPIGGQNFVHGHTASLALFRKP